MKAIVALHFELGYDQEVVADVFKVSQERISQEIELVRCILANRPNRSKSPYKGRAPKPEISLPTLIKLCFALAQP